MAAPLTETTRLSLSLFLGCLGQLFFTSGLNVFIAIVLYVIAVAIFVWSLTREGPIQATTTQNDKRSVAWPPFLFINRHWTDLVMLLIITVATGFFRLYRLDSQPAGLWIDETFTGVNALEIIEGKAAPIWAVTPLNRFRPEWVKTSNLYLHYVAFVLELFGPGHLALKMVSVLPAIGSVIAAFFLFRLMTSPRVAFFSAFLLASSHWSFTTGRWGWDQVLMSFLQTVCYGYLIKAFNTKNNINFIISGGVMGLCLYTYVASWIALAVALVYFAFKLTLDPPSLKVHLQGLIYFLLACAIIFLPLGTHYWVHPNDLTVRTNEISIADAITTTGTYAPLWENFKKYLLMFNYKGSANPFHNSVAAPQLDLVTSLFFVFGVAYCLRFWRHVHNSFLLLWFVLGLLAGLLTHPDDAPNAYRTAMITPVACLFAGTALSYFLDAAYRRLGNYRFAKLGYILTASFLLGASAAENYRIYFVKRLSSPDTWDYENFDWGIPKIIQHLRRETPIVYLDPLLLWDTVVVNSWYLNYEKGKLFAPAYRASHIFRRSEPIADATAWIKPIYYLAPPPVVPLIQKVFPGAQLTVLSTPFNKALFVIARLTTADWQIGLQYADEQELRAFAYEMSQLYRARAEVFLPSSPVRRLLIELSAVELDYAGKLDSKRPQAR